MSKHALIVDDSRLACKVMSNLLDGYKISSDSVYSAEEALEYLQHNQPDMIFLDHSMPGMDGLETIKVIKSNPKTAMVPVMMYTAKEGGVYVGQARALGAVDVLPKGLEKEHLNEALLKMGMIEKPSPPKSEQKELTTVQSPDDSPKDQDKSDSRSLLQNFWSANVEPYLNRQKVSQSEELNLSTRSQTRRLTREFHRTLESFEHAIMQRMESHDDFLNAQRNETTHRNKKWVVVGAVVFGLIQLILFRELLFLSESNQRLLASLEAQQNKISDMTGEIVALKQSVNTFEPVQLETIVGHEALWLTNTNGETIAEVSLLAGNPERLQAKTKTGYYFEVDRQGQMSSVLQDQFFLTENCQGDRFVDAKPGSLLVDSERQLWYTDRFSEEMQITVQSKLDSDGECIQLSENLVGLRSLLRNHSIETGADEDDSYQLISSL